jgi:hypothetical protein
VEGACQSHDCIGDLIDSLLDFGCGNASRVLLGPSAASFIPF